MNLDEDGYSASAVPVCAMFFLGASDASSVALRRMGAAEACMAIVEHSFWLDPTDLGQARNRLVKGGAAAGGFPVYKLDYPRDFQQLQRVREAIFDEISSGAHRVATTELEADDDRL